MKRDFSHEDFEEFLKRNADNLRMKAPEKVWQHISGELQKGRRRLGAGLSIFLLITALLGYYTLRNTDQVVRPTLTEKANPVTASTPPLSADAKASTVQRTENIPIARTQRVVRRQNTKRQPVVLTPAAVEMPSVTEATSPAETPGELVQNDFVPTIVDSYPEVEEEEKKTAAIERKPAYLSETDGAPWTIESATNAFTAFTKKRSRFQTQFHFTPTISYRKLTENKSYLRNTQTASAPANYAALYSSVNNMVTHKPDIGFELGITEKYAVSDKVRVRAGLQFNVNRYDIKAFHAPFALATIALNNRRAARVDSLWTISNYSNVEVSSNNKGSWLQNFSFQVSAPVGVELSLKGTEKMQFGIAGSVQPTYVLGDRAYMITSDYKSYTQIPWLLRRWNVNTAFETYVLYNTGKTTWQVGPQVRYQLLSSFISNYPVKENLFDFGLKIGVSLNK